MLPAELKHVLWVFAYGSLMWTQGFHVDESVPGVLMGWQRRFCLWSIQYRGTKNSPGLVLGLDTGGACQGLLLRLSRDNQQEVLDSLWQQEMGSSSPYNPRIVPVYSRIGFISALTFVVRHDHAQYCHMLTHEKQAEIITRSRGTRGTNVEYLVGVYDVLRNNELYDSNITSLYFHVSALAQQAQERQR
jgi:cation transport protein ChaC